MSSWVSGRHKSWGRASGGGSSSPLAVSGVTNTPSDPQEILRCTKSAPHIPPHVSPKDVSHMQSGHALRSSYLKRSMMTPFPNRATVLAMDPGVGHPRHVFEVHKPTTMYYTHKKKSVLAVIKTLQTSFSWVSVLHFCWVHNAESGQHGKEAVLLHLPLQGFLSFFHSQPSFAQSFYKTIGIKIN